MEVENTYLINAIVSWKRRSPDAFDVSVRYTVIIDFASEWRSLVKISAGGEPGQEDDKRERLAWVGDGRLVRFCEPGI